VESIAGEDGMKQNSLETGFINAGAAGWIPPTTTFASPPGSPATGSVYVFTDALTSGAAVGGGSALSTCRWSGSAWVSAGGSGGVTSVAMTVPAEFSVAGSPITTSGTLAVTKATQSANLVFAGPTTGSAAAPTFRAVVAADLPLASSSAFGAVKVDGTTITASSGVISAVGSAGGGPITQSDVTASRAVGSTYQNTTGGTMWVSVWANTTATAGSFWAVCDSGATPTLIVTATGNLGSTNVDVFFIVPSNYYYGVRKDQTLTLSKWIEYSGGGGGVIGTANFNGNGSITNAHYGGVISSVTFTSTGRYTVNLSASQTDFAVALTASDDSLSTPIIALSGTPDFHAGVTSFAIVIVALSGIPIAAALRNAGMITVTMSKL
jgi:hypothetical protein